ncbi:MAG: hypothetical protein OXH09_06675 [Gammaproteobacteria bacterium]|nr:hypothetical protein [Gammaproteobacteria bacterium]
MYPTVIDTLRFADRLKAAGFADAQAEGMARALGDELADNMVTKRDLDDAVQSLRLAIDAMDTKFEGLETKFEGLETKFEGLETKFDVRFNGLEFKSDGKFEGLEPRFEALDAKLEAHDREFSTKFNLLFGTMALGFTLIIGLIGYSLFSPRTADPVTPGIERHATVSAPR